MTDIIGPRFTSIDLDTVIVDDVTPLFTRKEDFLIYHLQHRRTPYNGTLWTMNAGAREQVFTKFDPRTSPAIAKKAGFNGSDQAWISYILGPNEAGWSAKDGVIAYRSDIRQARATLPPTARIVSFHGNEDPWSAYARQKAPWLEEHYR